MTSRPAIALAALTLAALVGCDVGSRIPGLGGSTNDSLLRIVNATGGALDLTSGGQVIGGEGHVNAGTASSCIRVNPAFTTLGLRESGAVSDVRNFAPTLAPGASYTAVAFTSDVGTTQALTLPNEFIPTSGFAGLRVVDVAPGLGSLDIYITPLAEPLGVPSTASIGFGGNTGFFDVNSGTSQIRFTIATTSALVYDAGTFTFQPGQLYTLVLAQPAGAAASPVASLVPAC